MLGGETCKYCYETPQPKASPTQEELGQKRHLGHFFPQRFFFFRGLGLVLYRKQTTRNLTQPNSFSANTLGLGLGSGLWVGLGLHVRTLIPLRVRVRVRVRLKVRVRQYVNSLVPP